MKFKVSQKEIERILNDPAESLRAGVNGNDPWWIIALKVIAYLIGLILGGAATTSCAHAMGIL